MYKWHHSHVESTMSTSDADTRQSRSERADETDEPEIEEDLIQEELRIDGICGVY
jgi:mycofactocin precursor